MILEKTFVLISCEIGTENHVFSNLKEIPEITDCLITYGDYDVVAKFVTDSPSDMERIISQIRKLDNIRSTITLRAIL